MSGLLEVVWQRFQRNWTCGCVKRTCIMPRGLFVVSFCFGFFVSVCEKNDPLFRIKRTLVVNQIQIQIRILIGFVVTCIFIPSRFGQILFQTSRNAVVTFFCPKDAHPKHSLRNKWSGWQTRKNEEISLVAFQKQFATIDGCFQHKYDARAKHESTR